MSALEIVAVIVSFFGIFLTTRRHILCWPVDLAACALYAALFANVRLYADMILQGLFAAASIYGWVAWASGAGPSGAVAVRRLPWLEAVVSMLAGAVGAIAIGWWMARHTDAALPWMDAALSSFSLVAQYWTARRYPASWTLWIVVDLVYVGMFAFKGLLLTAGLYGAFTLLAVAGLRRWMRAVVPA